MPFQFFRTDKRSDSQLPTISDNILPSNTCTCTKSRFHSKSKEVRFYTNSEFYVSMHGISGTTKFSQGPSRPNQGPNSDYQNSSFLQSSIGTNFPFSFGQTHCSSRFCSPRQTSLATSANVSFVCLETSHSSSRSSGHEQQYDLILFELVDGHQSFRTRNFHSFSRSQCIPLYGCQSLRMGSSSRADETILSWSLVRRPIPAPYQYVRNNGQLFHTEESHKIYSPFLRHYIYQQYNCGLLYRQTKHSPNLCIEVREILHWYLQHDVVIRVRHILGKFNILADRLSRLDRPIETKWALDQSIPS